jgi:hypothetical protein
MHKYLIKVSKDVTLSRFIYAISLDKAIDMAKLMMKQHECSYTIFEIE